MGMGLRGVWVFGLVLVLGLSGGCAVQDRVIRGLADELAAQGAAGDDDLELVREASPYHLKLSEAVLRRDPGHLALAQAVAAGFTQYAYAFVANEADRLEGRDAKGAAALRQRAAKLYRRGRDHALTALERQTPGFAAALAAGDAPFVLTPEQVGLAYWAAAAWGGYISLSKDDPDVVADFPLAYRLAQAAWVADPAYGEGSLSSLLGTFEAARPGGDARRVQTYFDLAITQAAGRQAGPYLAKAEGLALPRGERAAFLALLDQALAVPNDPSSPHALANGVMQRRAAWLKAQVDDWF